MGEFFVTTNEIDLIGYKYSKFFFHSSFASTATTIVSGAMAERANFHSYILFSFVNTVIYSVPAHWIWHEEGWLQKLGAIDYAGSINEVNVLYSKVVGLIFIALQIFNPFLK